jgi:hypothetical protein
MGVHLDLDPHGAGPGLERRAQVDLRVRAARRAAIHAEPISDGPQGIEDVTDAVGRATDVIKVLAVAESRHDVELVQAGPAPEDELLA